MLKTIGLHRARLLRAAIAAAITAPTVSSLVAQSPATSVVNVAGWVPADRVRPELKVSTKQNQSTKEWIYTYKVWNTPSSAQSIVTFAIRTGASIRSATAPSGWTAVATGPDVRLPAVIFFANPIDEGTQPSALRPGVGPLTFTVRTMTAPGSVKYFVRGNTPPLSREDMPLSDQARIPSPEEDALRGTITGPAH